MAAEENMDLGKYVDVRDGEYASGEHQRANEASEQTAQQCAEDP